MLAACSSPKATRPASTSWPAASPAKSALTTPPPQPSNENNERKTAMNDPLVPLVPCGGVWSRPALRDGPVRCAAHDLTPDEHDLAGVAVAGQQARAGSLRKTANNRGFPGRKDTAMMQDRWWRRP